MRRLLAPVVPVVAVLVVAGCSSSGAAAHHAAGSFTLITPQVGSSRTYAVKDGRVARTKVLTVTAATRSGSSVTATIRTTETGAATRSVTERVDADGTVDLPAQTGTTAKGVMVALGAIRVPKLLDLSSSRMSKQTVPVTVSSKGQVLHTVDDVVVAFGGQHRTVHVPAGTFDALVLTIDQSYTIGKTSFHVSTTEYVAQGHGVVEQDTVETVGGSGEAVSTDKLVSARSGTVA